MVVHFQRILTSPPPPSSVATFCYIIPPQKEATSTPTAVVGPEIKKKYYAFNKNRIKGTLSVVIPKRYRAKIALSYKTNKLIFTAVLHIVCDPLHAPTVTR